MCEVVVVVGVSQCSSLPIWRCSFRYFSSDQLFLDWLVYHIYLKEQAEYIQNQIDKIGDSVEDRQSRIAWQTINEVIRRKSTAKAKLKAASQLERVKMWEQHFKNLIGNPPKITDQPITRIISKQLDIKLGPFTK